MHNINNSYVISGILKPSLLFNQKNISSDFIYLMDTDTSPHWSKQQKLKTEHKQDKPKSVLHEVYLAVILKWFLVPGFLNYGNRDFLTAERRLFLAYRYELRVVYFTANL